jgi:hypothetical protein
MPGAPTAQSSSDVAALKVFQVGNDGQPCSDTNLAMG